MHAGARKSFDKKTERWFYKKTERDSFGTESAFLCAASAQQLTHRNLLAPPQFDGPTIIKLTFWVSSTLERERARATLGDPARLQEAKELLRHALTVVGFVECNRKVDMKLHGKGNSNSHGASVY